MTHMYMLGGKTHYTTQCFSTSKHFGLPKNVNPCNIISRIIVFIIIFCVQSNIVSLYVLGLLLGTFYSKTQNQGRHLTIICAMIVVFFFHLAVHWAIGRYCERIRHIVYLVTCHLLFTLYRSFSS
ncbi:hypothetical protein ACJX0J_009060, partial [Zea mays]